MTTPTEIPLFLLNTVLYPGGRLPLRVFETRYMDMVKDCLRNGTSFGVCLLEAGDEVLTPGATVGQPQALGTLATITDWNMPQFGILNVVAHGGQRFRVLDHRAQANGLVSARVEMLPDPAVTPIPGDFARLVPMLRSLLEALEDGAPPQPHRFYDANWVAFRWAEVLPLPLETRQQLLAGEDGTERLEAIYRFLEQEDDIESDPD